MTSMTSSSSSLKAPSPRRLITRLLGTTYEDPRSPTVFRGAFGSLDERRGDGGEAVPDHRDGELGCARSHGVAGRNAAVSGDPRYGDEPQLLHPPGASGPVGQATAPRARQRPDRRSEGAAPRRK